MVKNEYFSKILWPTGRELPLLCLYALKKHTYINNKKILLKEVCPKKNSVFFSIRPTFFKWGKIGQKNFVSACNLYRWIRYCMSYPEMALNVNIY